MLRVFASVFSMTIWLVLPSVALCQGVRVGLGGVKLSGYGEVNSAATIEQWNASEKQRMESFLELHIDLLVQACELSDAQVEKLRLLGKGVVNHKLLSGSAQLKNFMIESELTPEEVATEVDKDNPDKLKISGAKADPEHKGVIRFRTRFAQPLFEHPLWVGVLRTNLSEQQFTAYENFCRQRNQRFVELAIGVGIAELDAGVALTQLQREKINDIWREKLMTKTTASFPVSLEEATTLANPIIADRKLIEQVLTVHQRQALTFLDASLTWQGVGWVSR